MRVRIAAAAALNLEANETRGERVAQLEEIVGPLRILEYQRRRVPATQAQPINWNGRRGFDRRQDRAGCGVDEPHIADDARLAGGAGPSRILARVLRPVLIAQ